MIGRSVSFLLVLAALAGTPPASAVETLVISTKRVYPAPNVEPIENAIVVVRKGQITYVGKRESAFLGPSGGQMQVAADGPEKALGPLEPAIFFGREQAGVDQFGRAGYPVQILPDPVEGMQIA